MAMPCPPKSTPLVAFWRTTMPAHRPKVGFESQLLQKTMRRPIDPFPEPNKTGNGNRQYQERVAGQFFASLALCLSSSGDSMAKAIHHGRINDSTDQ